MLQVALSTFGECAISLEDRILNGRRWLQKNPKSRVDCVAFKYLEEQQGDDCGFQNVKFSRQEESKGAPGFFFVIRDDLLHPTAGGNKIRKLDALVPFLQEQAVTDVVTCGGCQSAHVAALAVACSEHGMASHALLRGEELTISTGYNLISGVYGNITYVSRSVYADRQNMLKRHAEHIAGSTGSVLWLHGEQLSERISNERSDEKFRGKPERCTRKKVAVVEEGAGDAVALPGLIRLVSWLKDEPPFHGSEKLRIVVDSGTGTTAVGLAVGIALFGLQWEVVGIMLADTCEGYEKQKTRLVTDFVEQFACEKHGLPSLPLVWRERKRKRRFGNILKGEIGSCKQVARETGILLDPIYTLAAWETALELSAESTDKVACLHTGGTLGLFGLAQRFPKEFSVSRLS